ncbi:hypothetical protein [Nocardioides sp.]|uniref:hypothetical protein n=1 Tax=Nocardioides sp. TaxID=35761 RepID=UPI002613CE0F|nr:hypothetical protein [Nocardioides sp.]
MIWLGLLWIGFGVVDAVHGATRRHGWPSVVGAAVVVGVAALAGRMGHLPDVVISVGVAVLVLGWGGVVRRGFGARLPALPLVYAGLATIVVIALNAAGEGGGGPLRDWLAASNIGYFQDLSADRFVLLLGAALVQGSTGNVLVRLVLLATHTVRPQQADGPEPGPSLKGGRLLGPLERLIILGLGLTGAYTAIGIVVAAKGLLRFPELQAARDATEGPSITEVTEYFLVGNFLSWTLALGTLALVAA